MKYYRIILTIPFLSSTIVACSDAGHGPPLPNRNDGTQNGVAPPKFRFVPGPEGRAVGVRAIVDVDGVQLTSEPVEVVLKSQSTQRSPASLNQRAGATAKLARTGGVLGGSPTVVRHPSAADSTGRQGTQCPTPGTTVESLGTVNGAVCYLSVTTAFGSTSAEAAHASTLIFAREGLYGMRSVGGNVYVPPDFAHVSSMQGVGCVFGDLPDAISSDYLKSLESIGISYSLFFYALGYTVFTSPGLGLVRAMQYDSGYSAAVSLLPVPISFGISVQTSSSTLQGPTFLRPWTDNCGSAGNTENPLRYFRDQVEALERSGTEETIEDALTTEVAAGALPLLDSLASAGEGGVAENVPAASNADMYAEFLSGKGNGLPSTATNTSIDGQLLDFKTSVGSSSDDTASVLSAVGVNQTHVEASIPSQVGQAALQRDAESAMSAAEQLTTSFGEVEAATKRFVSPKIVHVDVGAGDKAEITVSAREIADLVQYPAQDVMGATVIINAGTDIQNAAFTLSSDPLVLTLDLTKDSLLVRIDVDLTTAQGSFSPDASTWIVRPAMRLINVKPGKPTTALLSAPRQILSGGPASLNVQVVDAEGRLIKSPYLVRFVDDSGAELGQANPKYGTALFQHILKPSTPSIRSAEQIPLRYNGTDVSGLRITGTGLSKDSEVLLNDATTAISSDLVSVESPESMLVVLPQGTANGQTRVTLRNPGGQSSNSQTLVLSGL